MQIYYDFNFVSWSYHIHVRTDSGEIIYHGTRELYERIDYFIGIDVLTDILEWLDRLGVHDTIVHVNSRFVYDENLYTKSIKYKKVLTKLRKAGNFILFSHVAKDDMISFMFAPETPIVPLDHVKFKFAIEKSSAVNTLF